VPLPRRLGALGLALSAYDLWKKLPPQQRRQLVEQMRRHGPGVARQTAIVAREAAKRARSRGQAREDPPR
jgi:hypothetical protein